METIISNYYLTMHFMSFLDISSTIHLLQTQWEYHKIIIMISRYQMLQKCKPHFTIDSICQYGSVDVFKWFMKYQIGIYNFFIKSARYGNLEIVRYLVDQGANIHEHDDVALRWSAKSGHLEVIQQLFLQSKNNCSTRRQYVNIHA
jgi:hypothetical protein